MRSYKSNTSELWFQLVHRVPVLNPSWSLTGLYAQFFCLRNIYAVYFCSSYRRKGAQNLFIEESNLIVKNLFGFAYLKDERVELICLNELVHDWS